MPSQKNINQLTALKEKISQSKSIILTDYTGLNVANQTKLRSSIKQAGGQFLVAKNRLLLLALTQTSQNLDQEALKNALKHPTAVLFSYQDAIAALKILKEFRKLEDLPQIKLGILRAKDDSTTDRLLTLEEVEALADLPTKPELLAELIARLQSPTHGLVNVLKANLRNLVIILKSISEKQN